LLGCLVCLPVLALPSVFAQLLKWEGALPLDPWGEDLATSVEGTDAVSQLQLRRLSSGGAKVSQLQDEHGAESRHVSKRRKEHVELLSQDGMVRLVPCGLLLGGIFGMMGAGGSMVLKPILYYAFMLEPFKLAIFNNYAILVFLSAVGVARAQASKKVNWRHVGLLTVFTSILGTALGCFLASLVSSEVQLLSFGLVVVAVSAYMFQQSASGATKANKPDAVAPLGVVAALLAVGVGAMTGFMGAGGGFLLVPLLVHLGNDMHTAAPTSLAVIGMSSCSGLCWYAYWNDYTAADIDVPLVLGLSFIGSVGILLSGYVADLLSNVQRQRLFAGLLLLIGSGVIGGTATGFLRAT